MSGFTKLFSSLIFSTVWREELHVKVVWITMLAMANRHGEVVASIPGLADAARVTLAQCEEALAKFSAPDPYSRTKDHEGRRIETIDGGWHLLTYDKHRAIRDADERRIQTREAVRRYRARKAGVSDVSDSKHGKPRKPGKAQAEAEAEAEAEADRTPKKTLDTVSPKKWLLPFGKAWQVRCGESIPWDRLEASLFPLCEKFKCTPVLTAFRGYLNDTEPRYASPARFAATSAQWGLGNGSAPKGPHYPTADEADRAAGIPVPPKP